MNEEDRNYLPILGSYNASLLITLITVNLDLTTHYRILSEGHTEVITENNNKRYTCSNKMPEPRFLGICLFCFCFSFS